MPRPTTDVNGEEYQELLKQRELRRLHGADYPDVKWAYDAMDRLEKKQPYGDYTDKDYADFLKAQEIHARVFAQNGTEETAENHTTTHYIWRTRQDGKVRPEHAVNAGKIFAWNDPPPTGHPGEDYGCRCRAEPYTAEGEDAGGLQERSSQVVVYAAPDNTPAWTWEDFAAHYRSGTGEDVTLHEIGLLQAVIAHARTYNQTAAGGGTLFERVEQQIFKEARQKGDGRFTTSFEGGKYHFGGVVWALGHVPIHGNMNVDVVEKGEYLIITADIDYHFIDYFRLEDLNGEPEGEGTQNPQDRSTTPVIGTKAFYIRDDWSTHLEAIIKKDSGQN